MKFYSETLKELFDTEDALNEAEAKHAETLAVAKAKKEKASQERAVAAKKVEDAEAKMGEARKAYAEAEKAYRKELSDFCKKYGTYHKSVSYSDLPTLLNELFWF